jgi:hypothetical protein
MARAPKPPPCPHSNTGTRIEGSNEVEYCKSCGDVVGFRDIGHKPDGTSREK